MKDRVCERTKNNRIEQSVEKERTIKREGEKKQTQASKASKQVQEEIYQIRWNQPIALPA